MFVKLYPVKGQSLGPLSVSYDTEEDLLGYARAKNVKCDIGTDEGGAHYKLGYVSKNLPPFVADIIERIVVEEVVDSQTIKQGYYKRARADASYTGKFLRVEGTNMYAVAQLYNSIRRGGLEPDELWQ